MFIEDNKDDIRSLPPAEKYLLYHTLKAIPAKLNTGYFIQSHWSYVVNRLLLRASFRET
ncbi:hypothetical protein DRW42_06910 [Pedobacter miscanthi]|uniref:HTH LytTR-type domain-containing protein n=2 Tax=Pedobacter miscanthi TaxID=2259170 RepID=A0A366L639_9SPHI|nr:hypothetical protein DRW42_06910 [Pedobacter miscanthi]